MTLPEHIKSYLDAIAGDERFVLTLGAGVVNTVLLTLGFLDQSNYVTLTMGTIAVYIAGRTADGFANGKAP